MKQRLLLGTAGHIDHGKTSLVKALTGTDTDRLPEEKRRQITIELGFASLELDDCLLGIVDVPGHERFVKNMLAGATGIDFALLVVAVDDSVKPQTREHLEILQYLQLSAGVIALTKCDAANSDWIDLVEAEVRELVAGTFLEAAPIVRVSARAGTGLKTLRTALAEAARLTIDRNTAEQAAPFRMAIDRVFTIAGHGTVVTGGVASGQVSVGDSLQLQPQGIAVRVRGLHCHDTSVEQAGRGQRAAINLSGIRYHEVARGQCLVSPDTLRPSRTLTVSLSVSPRASKPLKHRTQVRLHVGTAEVLARVALLDRSPIEPGSQAFVQLFLQSEVAVVWGQPFVIRAVSPLATLGGGQVLDPVAKKFVNKNRFLTPELQKTLVDLSSEKIHQRAAAAAYLLGAAWWCPDDLFPRAGVVQCQQVVDQLVSEKVVRRLDLAQGKQRLIHSEIAGDLEHRIEKRLLTEHEKSPLSSWVEHSRMASYLGEIDSELLDALLRGLTAAGRIVVKPLGVALASWQPKLSNSQTQSLEDLVELFRTARFQPPNLTEASALIGQRSEAIVPLLEVAQEQGFLIRIAEGFYLHPEVVDSAKKKLRDQMAGGAALLVSDIRELLDTSRKFAIPFCEYLDAIEFTRREGNARKLAQGAMGSHT